VIVCCELAFDLRLERVEPLGELVVSRQHFAKLHEGTDYIDADFDRARGVQDRGGHDGAVLGERIRQVTASTAPGL